MKTLPFVPFCVCIVLLIGEILPSDGSNMERQQHRLLQARRSQGNFGIDERSRDRYGVKRRRRSVDPYTGHRDKRYDLGDEDPGLRAMPPMETLVFFTTTQPVTTTTPPVTTEKPTTDGSSGSASSAAKAWSIIYLVSNLLAMIP